MTRDQLGKWQHSHIFGNNEQLEGEKRTRWVVVITVLTMTVEITAGILFGSMALLADGWHMGTHAAALGVTLFAYAYARKHSTNPRYTFGTGKVSSLGGFASAIGLALVALLVLGESVSRLTAPVNIHFGEAIGVAVLGLVVNLACALLLRNTPHHDHNHHHHGGHHHSAMDPHHHDHNLRGAYLHVMADALTSVLAILALLAGRELGWMWMDPAMGIVGSLIIASWSIGLLRDTSRVLLDAEVSSTRRAEVKEAIESIDNNQVADLHVWQVGPKHLAAIISVVSREPRSPDHYKTLLGEFPDISHVTVEVHREVDAGASAAST